MNKYIIAFSVLFLIALSIGIPIASCHYDSDGCSSNNNNTNNNSSKDVDCVMSDYGEWKGCVCPPNSTTGVQSRSRTITIPQQGSGKVCGGLTDQRPCDCKSEDCEWGEWGVCDCDKKTQTRIKRHKSGDKCSGDSVETRDCQCVVKDCEWSDWSDFSSCSKACDDGNGGGSKIKTRHVLQHEENGGKACVPQGVWKNGDPSTKIDIISEDCNTQKCDCSNSKLSELKTPWGARCPLQNSSPACRTVNGVDECYTAICNKPNWKCQKTCPPADNMPENMKKGCKDSNGNLIPSKKAVCTAKTNYDWKCEDIHDSDYTDYCALNGSKPSCSGAVCWAHPTHGWIWSCPHSYSKNDIAAMYHNNFVTYQNKDMPSQTYKILCNTTQQSGNRTICSQPFAPTTNSGCVDKNSWYGNIYPHILDKIGNPYANIVSNDLNPDTNDSDSPVGYYQLYPHKTDFEKNADGSYRSYIKFDTKPYSKLCPITNRCRGVGKYYSQSPGGIWKDSQSDYKCVCKEGTGDKCPDCIGDTFPEKDIGNLYIVTNAKYAPNINGKYVQQDYYNMFKDDGLQRINKIVEFDNKKQCCPGYKKVSKSYPVLNDVYYNNKIGFSCEME